MFGRKWRHVLFFVALGSWMGLSSVAAHATTFTQCPATGYANSCDGLLTVGPGGSLTLAIDPTQRPVDGFDDTLLGIQNNSGKSLSSLFVNFSNVTSQKVFPSTFNTDGAFLYGGNGYWGPDTKFALSGSNSDLLTFTTSLANGASTYFEVESAPSAFGNGGSLSGTPEPSSYILFGTGIAALLLLRRRKAVTA